MERRNHSGYISNVGNCLDRMDILEISKIYNVDDALAKQLFNELADEIEVVFRSIDEIEQSGNIDYLKAIYHCLDHVQKGGTIETFKPLVRTPTYAGQSRRNKSRHRAMH